MKFIDEAIIRMMRPDDAKAVTRLIHALADSQGSKAVITPAQLLKNYRRNGTKILVADINRKIIGYLLSTPRYNFEYAADEWTIDYLFVDSKFRGKGIGQQLIQAWAAKAKKAGVKCLRTSTGKTNPANRLYKSTGFKRNLISQNRYIAYGKHIEPMAQSTRP